MEANKFTEKVIEALGTAQAMATRSSHQQVDVEHILLALLDQDGGLTTPILQKAGVPV